MLYLVIMLKFGEVSFLIDVVSSACMIWKNVDNFIQSRDIMRSALLVLDYTEMEKLFRGFLVKIK